MRPRRSCQVRRQLRHTKLNEPGCTICLTPRGEMVARGKIAPCDHLFCWECIREWSDVTASCPSCKSQFKMISKMYMNGNFASGNSPKRVFVPRAVPDTPQDEHELIDVLASDSGFSPGDNQGSVDHDLDTSDDSCSSYCSSDSENIAYESDAKSGTQESSDEEGSIPDTSARDKSGQDEGWSDSDMGGLTRMQSARDGVQQRVRMRLGTNMSTTKKTRRAEVNNANGVVSMKRQRYSALGAALASLERTSDNVRTNDSALSTTGWIAARAEGAVCEESRAHNSVVSVGMDEHHVRSKRRRSSIPAVVHSKFFHAAHTVSSPRCTQTAHKGQATAAAQASSVNSRVLRECPKDPQRQAILSPPTQGRARGGILVPETPDADVDKSSARHMPGKPYTAAVMATPQQVRHGETRAPPALSTPVGTGSDDTRPQGVLAPDTPAGQQPPTAGGGRGPCKTTGWISVAPRHRQHTGPRM
eukprot:m.897033 g.897033  ORF g.897033 m.897033 type:complete len:474 (+) comp23669_c0_seq14:280-1701(+)